MCDGFRDIIDTSSAYQGAGATRYQADAMGAHDQDVGLGTMRLYVDSEDPQRPVLGHRWSTSSGSAFFGRARRDLFIGRYAG